MTMKKFKLPKTFAEKWLTDLRSENYRQAHGVLHKNGKFCCLGVACITAGYSIDDLKTPGGSFATVIKEFKEEEDDENRETNFLAKDLPNVPEELKGGCLDNGLVGKLTDMNDCGLYSFTELAEWIENNVEFYE